MPRQARLALAGIPWHIIQRSNNRSACFRTLADYHYYLTLLGVQAKKFSCAVHAYVLMSDHVHLLVTPEQTDSASMMMKHLGQGYVQYFNNAHQRTGRLWHGRFKSCLVQEGQHMLDCYRYIELNPVRAGLVNSAADYPWSSFRYNGFGRDQSILSPHRSYLDLAEDALERRKRYRDLLQLNLEPEVVREIRSASNSNLVLGDEAFKDEIERRLNRSVRLGGGGRPRSLSESDFEPYSWRSTA